MLVAGVDAEEEEGEVWSGFLAGCVYLRRR